MRFDCLAFISAAVTLALGASVPKIKSDLQAVLTGLNAMNRDLASFSSPDAGHATLIAQDAGGVVSWLQVSTVDVNDTPPWGVGDGQSILTLVEDAKPRIFSALDVIVQKKPFVVGAGFGSLAGQMLSQLKVNTDRLATALILKAPGSQRGQATRIRNEILQAFANALAAYPA